MTRILLILQLISAMACAEDRLRILGSSVLHPYMSIAAEEFASRYNLPSPIVESTGTGGGFKLFCSHENYGDIVSASRPITEREVEFCHNNIGKLEEFTLGYDAIVFATNNDFKLRLTKEQLYRALAKYIYADNSKYLNPYKKWSDIDNGLPDEQILIYGPPSTAGARDLINKKLFIPFCETRAYDCTFIREDGAYTEVGRGDNLILHKIKHNKLSMGIINYSSYLDNQNLLKAVPVDGVVPDKISIRNKSYGFIRPLYFYLIKGYNNNKLLVKFLKMVYSTESIGENGFLTVRGLDALSFLQ